ncbi:aldehyde dehydrogenase family protein [Nocardia sp. CA-128927]|uniref:aldehyde dehydrogenase family protein n=1 Tax=Nocardia sp. CA-128927 TaxID=3239975 RepID=UPI003D96B08E
MTISGLPHARNYIDGQWVDSATHIESSNPATGKVLGTFAEAGADEARAAIAAADALSRPRTGPATAICGTGRSSKWPATDLTIPKLRYYAALALSDHGGAAEVRPGLYSMTLREAAGVAGVIAPWNSPIVLAATATFR